MHVAQRSADGACSPPWCTAHLSRPRDRLGGSWKSTERHSSMRVVHSSAKRWHTPAAWRRIRRGKGQGWEQRLQH